MTQAKLILGGLISRRPQDCFDGHVFGLGCLSLVQQYPESIGERVFVYLAQYARSFADASSGNAKASNGSTLPPETTNVAHFLEMFVAEREVPRSILATKLPMPLLDFVSRG